MLYVMTTIRSRLRALGMILYKISGCLSCVVVGVFYESGGVAEHVDVADLME